MKSDAAYYETHYSKLLSQYPEQWVVIYNQKVVGAGEDVKQVLIDAKSKGIPLRRALVKHVTSKEDTWILAA